MAFSSSSLEEFEGHYTAPEVSVIIPIHNGVADLPDLEHCLLQQSFPHDRVEYVLVDNKSQDDTLQFLQALAERSRQRGITVVPLSETAIQSSYAARNRGMQAAKGQFWVFTDADCRPEPNWLIQMVEPFQNSRVGIVVGEVKALPGSSLWEKYAESQETLSQKFAIAHPFYPYGQTANLAVRRAAVERSGLFRPYLTTGGDADLCWRIQMSGAWQLHFAAAAIVRHRHRSKLKALGQQWQRYGRSNAYLHELYGVALQPDLGYLQLAQRLARWLSKEAPIAIWRWLQGRGRAIELISTPIGLYCQRSRAVGQRHARLPAVAKSIDWLNGVAAAIKPETLSAQPNIDDCPFENVHHNAE